MVLGVENKWAKKFEGIYNTIPNWYEDTKITNFNSYSLTKDLTSFNNSFNKVFNIPFNKVFNIPSTSSGFSSGFRFPNFDNFQKPTTTKIAIQVGHLVEEKIPPELLKISKIGAVVNDIKEV